MKQFLSERTIEASIEDVFDVVAHIENFQKALPHIVGIEYLTEQNRGVGTRFKETRMMGKREATTELEVREYEPPALVRMVSDAGGTVWDTVFRLTAAGSATRLAMEMDAIPHKLMAKLSLPLIGGFVAKAVEKDLDAVKVYCEGSSE
ncbi:MAG: SRPBCC family protein [Acidimicrobiia bacterium]|nr:SRPBCC family protein [Acidimicrobiia bacterium]